MNPNAVEKSGFLPAYGWLAAICLSLLAGNCHVVASDSDATDVPEASGPKTNASISNRATNSHGELPLPKGDLDSLDDKHKLAIGDSLSFRIVEDLTDPKPLTVSDSGDLEVPYIGRVPAQGKTCRQLAGEIKTALEKKYYYHATVVLAVDEMVQSRGKVYLAGPVRVPGAEDIPSDEILTLSKAILRAGGLSDRADGHNVKVIRKGSPETGGKRTFVVDVKKIFDQGKVELDLPLEPGDLIVVPERLVRF